LSMSMLIMLYWKPKLYYHPKRAPFCTILNLCAAQGILCHMPIKLSLFIFFPILQFANKLTIALIVPLRYNFFVLLYFQDKDMIFLYCYVVDFFSQ
jgi:hypothetical protein